MVQLTEIPSDAQKPVDTNLDLFFDYTENAKTSNLDGEILQNQKLPGLSGASIWELQNSAEKIWSPESIIRVVAVQSAYIDKKYFRAINWLAVANILEQIDNELANIMRTHLSG